METDTPKAIASRILWGRNENESSLQVWPLSGGANNRVYKIQALEQIFLLKCYFRHPNDPRNRCKADFEFTTLAWSHGIRLVPRPLGVSWEDHAAAYEFVVGSKIAAPDVDGRVISQAASLFAGVNCRRTGADAANLDRASEACFSIREHIECIDRRVRRLLALDRTQSAGAEAAKFVVGKLSPEWERVRNNITSPLSNTEIGREIEPGERCISPSDFGFHNALREVGGTLRFFDFEYAGWDDPAKMICDFFCQPEIPAPADAFDLFTRQALEPFAAPEIILRRARLLLPAYRIKWCCIMLNEFLGIDSQRREFSGIALSDLEARKRNQLAKADDSIQLVRSFLPS